MAETLPKIRRCESCGCTDLAPCPEGCSWDPTFESVGRYICTRCGGKAAFADALEEYLDPPSSILLPGDPEFEATIMEMRSR